MRTRRKTWAIVLAAGDGTRLATLTTDDCGNAVPKQFCSLSGGNSLLHEALQRARRIVPRGRVCAIVARQHERYWRPTLRSLPRRNVIVEPRNCGTANGVLHGVLRILERDPHARIIFLPADHYVRNELPLANSMRAAATLLTRGYEGLLLVGIEPDDVDPELGYIVPGAPVGDGTRRVAQFIEKPAVPVARELIARGAVWNSFIFAAQAAALLALIRARLPAAVDGMTKARARDLRRGQDSFALDELYERLPTTDFSRSVVQNAESVLRVLTTGACGWTDLGTPRRVAKVLQLLPKTRVRGSSASRRPIAAFVNLAAQYARLGMINGYASGN